MRSFLLKLSVSTFLVTSVSIPALCAMNQAVNDGLTQEGLKRFKLRIQRENKFLNSVIRGDDGIVVEEKRLHQQHVSEIVYQYVFQKLDNNPGNEKEKAGWHLALARVFFSNGGMYRPASNPQRPYTLSPSSWVNHLVDTLKWVRDHSTELPANYVSYANIWLALLCLDPLNDGFLQGTELGALPDQARVGLAYSYLTKSGPEGRRLHFAKLLMAYTIFEKKYTPEGMTREEAIEYGDRLMGGEAYHPRNNSIERRLAQMRQRNLVRAPSEKPLAGRPPIQPRKEDLEEKIKKKVEAARQRGDQNEEAVEEAVIENVPVVMLDDEEEILRNTDGAHTPPPPDGSDFDNAAAAEGGPAPLATAAAPVFYAQFANHNESEEDMNVSDNMREPYPLGTEMDEDPPTRKRKRKTLDPEQTEENPDEEEQPTKKRKKGRKPEEPLSPEEELYKANRDTIDDLIRRCLDQKNENKQILELIFQKFPQLKANENLYKKRFRKSIATITAAKNLALTEEHLDWLSQKEQEFSLTRAANALKQHFNISQSEGSIREAIRLQQTRNLHFSTGQKSLWGSILDEERIAYIKSLNPERLYLSKVIRNLIKKYNITASQDTIKKAIINQFGKDSFRTDYITKEIREYFQAHIHDPNLLENAYKKFGALTDSQQHSLRNLKRRLLEKKKSATSDSEMDEDEDT